MAAPGPAGTEDPKPKKKHPNRLIVDDAINDDNRCGHLR
jgi:hypothetical protein